VEVLFYWGSRKNFECQGTSSFLIMVVLNGQKGVILMFFGSKLKLNFVSMFDQSFSLKKWKQYFLGDPKTFLSPKLNYGHFKGPTRGNFGVFFWSKLKFNFLSIFGQFFL
jgi:hypothetical protein